MHQELCIHSKEVIVSPDLGCFGFLDFFVFLGVFLVFGCLFVCIFFLFLSREENKTQAFRLGMISFKH